MIRTKEKIIEEYPHLKEDEKTLKENRPMLQLIYLRHMCLSLERLIDIMTEIKDKR